MRLEPEEGQQAQKGRHGHKRRNYQNQGALNPELRTCYEYDKLLELSHLSLQNVPDARSRTLTLNQINSPTIVSGCSL